MLISDVLSVIQDLPRPRQVAILDLVYDKLDTKVERDQLTVFGMSDQDVIRLLNKQFKLEHNLYRYEGANGLENLRHVTRLSALFAIVGSKYDIEKYSMSLSVETVYENYAFNPTALAKHAIAYVLIKKKLIVEFLEKLGYPRDIKLIVKLVELAARADDLDTTEQILEYLLMRDEEEEVGYVIRHELLRKIRAAQLLRNNESSRRIMQWIKDGPVEAYELVRQIIYDLAPEEVEQATMLLRMIGERVEDYYLNIIEVRDDADYVDCLKAFLMTESFDVVYVLSSLRNIGDERGINFIQELANNQV